MLLDLKELKDLEERKLVRIQRHPSRPLFIANYTEKVQFDRLWNEHPYLLQCRGIIYDLDGYVWSRPFPKFFNLEEHKGPLPTGAFEVTEKLDGSLGILYGSPHNWSIATRGSFASEQSEVATEILRTKYPEATDWFLEEKTYLFEIIYPENRIVVDYNGMSDIILIAVIDNATGRDDNSVRNELGPFNTAKKYTNIRTIADLVVAQTNAEGDPNFEGYVVRWLDNDYRLKVKLDEYLRLHRIMTGITDKRIWEAMKNNDNLDAWLENVPDEFANELKEKMATFNTAFNRKVDACLRIYERVMAQFDGFAFPDRKQFAMEAVKHPARDILFLMYDGKPWEKRIWKMLEPKVDSREPEMV